MYVAIQSTIVVNFTLYKINNNIMIIVSDMLFSLVIQHIHLNILIPFSLAVLFALSLAPSYLPYTQ